MLVAALAGCATLADMRVPRSLERPNGRDDLLVVSRRAGGAADDASLVPERDGCDFDRQFSGLGLSGDRLTVRARLPTGGPLVSQTLFSRLDAGRFRRDGYESVTAPDAHVNGGPGGIAVRYGACDVRRLIPEGYRLRQVAQGDLNDDGREDVLIVSQGTDAAFIEPGKEVIDSYSEDRPTVTSEINRNAYMLTVAYAKPDGSGCEVAARDGTLIPAREHRNFEDPFDGAEIRAGVMIVKLRFFMSMGSWHAENRTLRFRRQGDAFRLIGVDSTDWMRNSGQMWRRSVNYLTGRMSTEYFADQEEEKGEVSWTRLPPSPPVFFGRMGSGLDHPLPKDKR